MGQEQVQVRKGAARVLLSRVACWTRQRLCSAVDREFQVCRYPRRKQLCGRRLREAMRLKPQ
eukprot:1435183-Rhodomonas_salina.1